MSATMQRRRYEVGWVAEFIDGDYIVWRYSFLVDGYLRADDTNYGTRSEATAAMVREVAELNRIYGNV